MLQEVLQKTEPLHKTDLPDLPKKGDHEGHPRDEVEAPPPEQQDVAATGRKPVTDSQIEIRLNLQIIKRMHQDFH